MEPTHKKTGFLDALEQLDREPASSHGGSGREGGEWGAVFFTLALPFLLATPGQLPSFTCPTWVLLASQFLTPTLADLF